MRIGINARTFSDPEPDGAVQTALELTRRLLSEKNFSVRLYGHPTVAGCFDDPVDVASPGYRSDSPMFGVLWERTVLPMLILRDDIDLLLCPNGNAPPFPLPGCKVFMYVHDVNAQKGMSSGIHQLYRKSMVPLGAKFAHRILTVSNFSKGEIIEYLGVPGEKIDVIYNGIDEAFLDPDPGTRFDLPENYILYVGAMNPRKNIDHLIRSFRAFKTRWDHPHQLVLIGPGNKGVYKKFDIDALEESIVTPGFLPQSELKYAYQNSDLFVYPSLYEGFGLPPLEAMACGAPVIASNTSSLPEILDSSAVLVDPHDVDELSGKMHELLTDDTLRESLIRRGKERSRRFTWERAAEELIESFSS
jgi:glycosyltransferase involved in cell wall biosynthesis